MPAQANRDPKPVALESGTPALLGAANSDQVVLLTHLGRNSYEITNRHASEKIYLRRGAPANAATETGLPIEPCTTFRDEWFSGDVHLSSPIASHPYVRAET